MRNQDQLLEEVMNKVSQQVSNSIKDIVTESIEKELTSNLTRSLIESEFYRRLSDDMRFGLQAIYKEIRKASKENNGGSKAAVSGSVSTDKEEANKLFYEASHQLDEVRVTLEEATNDIMDILEKQMEARDNATDRLDKLAAKYPDDEDIKELANLEGGLSINLTELMTQMSFQDLTGQRIKRIITALQSIEKTVFELYMSTGLIIKAHQETPDRDFHELEAETKAKVSTLNGPDREASQDDVDDLLSQLGLE